MDFRAFSARARSSDEALVAREAVTTWKLAVGIALVIVSVAFDKATPVA